MPPLTNPPGSTTNDITLTHLACAYPAFAFTLLVHGTRRPRWLAVRTKGTDPGLHTIMTADLSELHAALARDAARPPGTARAAHSEQGSHP